MLKAMGVALVCWVYMTIYMKSVFLASFSLLNICMSVPISLVIYNCFVSYFSSIHIAIVVIIIGIGSDNIFVMHDAWVSSQYEATLELKLS